MDEFLFDLQRFDGETLNTWVSDTTTTNTWIYTYKKTESDTATYTVKVSGVSSSPTGNPLESATLTPSGSISDVKVTCSDTSASQADFKFKSSGSEILYTPCAKAETFTAETQMELIPTITYITESTSVTVSTTQSQTEVPFRIITTTDGSTNYTDYCIVFDRGTNNSATFSTDAKGTVKLNNCSSPVSYMAMYPLQKDNTKVLNCVAFTLASGNLKIAKGANQEDYKTIRLYDTSVDLSIPTNFRGNFEIKSGTDSSVEIGITAYDDKYFYLGNFKLTYESSSTLNTSFYANIDNDNNFYFIIDPESTDTKIVENNKVNGNITVTGPDNSITYTVNVTKGNVRLGQNSNGKPYISDLTEGDTFTLTTGNETITYEMGSSKLFAIKYAADGTTRLATERSTVDITESTLIELSKLKFDDTTNTYLGAILLVDEQGTGENKTTSLTISESTLQGVTFPAPLADKENNSYGSLFKNTTTGNYELVKGNSDKKLTYLNIDAGLTVIIDKALFDVPITVADTTKFVSTSSIATSLSDSLTVTSDSDGLVSITGSKAVSIGSGSIKTDQSDQSISAGTYSVSGYGAGTLDNSKDGIILSLSSAGSLVVGDIDIGESFIVNGNQHYTLLSSGLFTNDDNVYRLYETSGATTFAADLADLGTAKTLISPSVISDVNVLEIGKINTINGSVYDSVTLPTTEFASLGVTGDGDSKTYTLTTVSATATEAFNASVGTISLTGGNTTIYKALAGSNVTIATVGDGTANSGTTFKVTAVSGDTFTVSSIKEASPQVTTDATAITLLSGSINAQAGQTIALGAGTNPPSLKVEAVSSDNELIIEFDSESSIATVKGTVGDTFTIGGKQYKVDNGDGMGFVIDGSGAVTVDSLTAAGADVFTYDNSQYSVKSGGFIRQNNSNYSIWTPDNHSLSGNSVLASSLDVTSNWGNLITLSGGSVTLKSGDLSPATFIDENFANTYGTLEHSGNNHTITTSTADSGKLNHVSVTGVATGASLTSNLTNVTIASNLSSIQVDKAASDNYQVLINDGTSLKGANAATLYSGSLTADSGVAEGVAFGSKTVKADESVTLITDSNGANASIAGLSWNEKLSVNGSPYTFTGAGLLSGSKILYGTKTASSIGTLELDSIDADNGDWRDMIATSVDGGGGVTINSSSANKALLVDAFNSTLNPTKLYGELNTASGGWSLTTVTNGDNWESTYTINIDNQAVTMSSGFTAGSIAGAASGAAFKVNSLKSGATEFAVTDSSSGANLGSVSALTQTAGLIAESGINTIVVGSDTVSNSDTDGLKLNVSVNDSGATLGALDSSDTFTLNGTLNCSINGLGLMTEDRFLKDSLLSNKSVVLSNLKETNSWYYISTINNGVFSVPATEGSSDGASEWVILDSNKETRFGTLTSLEGGYSIVKSGSGTWSDNTIKITDATLSLTSDFRNISIEGANSGAAFTVSDNASYSVADSSAGATIGGAKSINQTAGRIALKDTAQTIKAGDYSVSGGGQDITVSVSGGKATVGALKTDDSFKVGSTTYTLLSNGRFVSSDNKIWNGVTIKTNDTGSIAVESLSPDTSWNSMIETDSEGNLTIESSAENSVPAYVVQPATSGTPTIIYGTLDKVTDGNYTLSTEGKTNATLNSVTITDDAQPVTFTKDLVNISLHAGENDFKVTKGNNGFTVNYSNDELSIDTATAVELTKGKLTLKDTNDSLIATANNISVQAVKGDVNVTYQDSGLKVDNVGLSSEEVGESFNLAGKNYSVIAGDGFSVEITGNGAASNTSVQGISSGDKFIIDDVTFIYTNAGLAKTKTKSAEIAYILRNGKLTGDELTLDSLQSTNSDTWLGVSPAANGNVTISTDFDQSVVLIDSIENPTTNYGQVTLEDGTYKLSQYGGGDSELGSINQSLPSSITVKENVNLSIDDGFKNVSVTSSEADEISVNSLKVGGTVAVFLPSTSTFTPTTDDKFTVNGTEYLMTGAGLTSGDSIWTAAGVSDYVLPDTQNSWSHMLKLTDAGGVLDFNSDSVTAATGNNVVVDSGATERRATLTYSANSYTFKSFNNKTIDQINLADGNTSLTTDFATTIETGNGTYTINKKAYTGDDLTIKATDNTSTLYDGTVSIASGASVADGNNISISTSSGTITATASEGAWTSLGNLSDGDTFTLNGTKYKVYDTNTLVKLNDTNDIEALYTPLIENGTLTYAQITSDKYNSIISLNEDSRLDLTSAPAISATTIVIGYNDPTTRVAEIEYDSGTYTLKSTSGGSIDKLDAVLLGTSSNSFSTALNLDVITTGKTTFTINDKSFAAQTALTIETESSNAFLKNGTITLAQGSEVDTRTTAADENITATTGEITVKVDEDKSTVTISDIDSSDVFKVGSNTYTMTAIGLTDGTNLNCAMLSGKSITTAELSGDDWKEILQAKSGAMVVNSTVASDAFVADVDTSSPDSAVKYGTLSASDGTYTLTQDSTDSNLTSATVNGVKLTLPAADAAATITALGATFKVTATKAFTVDAATDDLATISDVTGISLTSGEINAPTNIPITVGASTITATTGALTVGISSGRTFVGELNTGDKFEVDGTKYEKTTAGLLDTTNQKLRPTVTDTYYIGDEFDRIIAPENKVLDLTSETESALVYDSVSNPTTQLGTLTVTDDGKLNLSYTSETAGELATLEISEGADLTVDFVTQVSTNNSATVNGVSYSGNGTLVIDTTADTSTLYSGTITLAENESAQATNDTTALKSESGTINATAAEGKFATISKLDAGDIFTFGGGTYTQTSIGLLSDGKLNTAVESSVEVSDLSGDSWRSILQATDGALSVDDGTDSELLVADITDDKSKCVLYGTLTGADGAYTLTRGDTDGTLTSATIDGVKLTLPSADTSATLTALGATFKVTATKAFTVDASTDDLATISDVTGISLTSGEINAPTNIPITVGASTITATTGALTVGISSGRTFVGELNTGDKFEVDGTKYEKTTAGLLDTTNQKLRPTVTDTYYIGDEFDRIIAPENKVLDLTSETESALVYDSVSNPTTQLGTLTVTDDGKLNLSYTSETAGELTTLKIAEGADLTVDFVTQVSAKSAATVNGVSYSGSGSLVIDTTTDTSTLYSGTITLAENESVQATNDTTALKSESGTINATAAEGKFATISKLDAGDIFTLGGSTYTQTSIGLLSDGKLNTAVESSVEVSDLSGDSWRLILQATDGAMSVDDGTDSNLLVADITEDKSKCVLYGTLTGADGAYTLTRGDNDGTLTSATVDGVKLTLPSADATATLTALGATFKVTATKAYTVDASMDDLATISDVTGISLTSGEINAPTNIPITVGASTITATTGALTVGISSGRTFVGELNTGDKFEVDGTKYEKTTAGLLDTTNQQLNTTVGDTYYLGDAFERIIAVKNGVLDLTNETGSALVYDSISNPTTQLGTLTITDDGKLTLEENTDEAGKITTVKVAKGADLTVDFETQVSAKSAATVNGVSYSGSGTLIIDTTSDISTLYSGTITLAENESAQATNDTTALKSESGTINATAAEGKFATISKLDAGYIFTFDGGTYTQTSIGLLSDGKLNTAVESSVEVSDLSGDSWRSILQATDGAMSVDDGTDSNLLVADITDDKSKCVLYGTLTGADGAYTLTRGDSDGTLTSATVDGVKLTLPAADATATLTASGATFEVTATKAFTIDASTDDLATISDVTGISLTSGEINAPTNIPITVGASTITATTGALTVGISSGRTFVGELNTGDKFEVDGTKYEKTTAGLLDTTNQKLRPTVTDTYYIGDEFDRIIAPENKVLDLTNETESALVYDSVSNPTTQLGTLTITDDGKLNLSYTSETAGELTTLKIAEGADLTVDFVTQVSAKSAATVNGVSYSGSGSLVIDTTTDTSTLYSGTITLAENESVQATNDTTALKSESGTINATAAEGKFATISKLDAGDSFTFGGGTYTQTSIGLLSDGKLNTAVESSVEVSDLSGDSWRLILQATDGAMSVDDGTDSNLLVADITDDKSKCVLYGTLTGADGAYTLTRGDNDGTLTSATVDGVKLTLPSADATATLTALGATFKVTATKAFTVDASTDDLATISDVTGINLTSGEINAPTNIGITANGSAITATKNAMTVGISDGKTFVGELNTGDKFEVDGTKYEKSSAGLLDTTNQQLNTTVGETYYLGDEFERIIAVKNGVLDLTNETESALVYDSVSNPTTQLGTLTITDGKLTLEENTDEAGKIGTVKVAKGADLTVDFVTQVSAKSAATVNGVSYNGSGTLIIDTTSDSATLYSGTITLAENESAQATNDTTALKSESGTINATASEGKFATISKLDAGDIFTLGGSTYTQTSIGLLSDGKLNTAVESTVEVSDLSGDSWQTILQATDGAMSVDDGTDSNLLVADITEDKSKCVFYGTLTGADGAYTLTRGDSDGTLTSATVDGVKLTLPAADATATLTALGATFKVTATKAYTVDASTDDLATISDVTGINLTSGEINAPTNIGITANGSAITATKGALTVGISDGKTFVGELNTGDKFEVDGTKYEKTSAGLLDVTNQKLRPTVTDTYYIGDEFDRIIAPENKVLDLTDETESALVYDSVSNPTTQLGTLTVTDDGKLTLEENTDEAGKIGTVKVAKGADLTVDFETQVSAKSAATVNGVSYNGSGTLIIDTTSDSATLYSGTITLAENESAQATNDTTALKSESGTINATASEGKFATISKLDAGDIFTLGGSTYTQTSIGLLSDGKLNTAVESTVEVSDLSGDSWRSILQATDGAMSVDDGTDSELLVADITEDKSKCVFYGTLTGADGAYTLTQGDSDGTLTSATVDGVKLTLPAADATATLTALGATFKVTATKAYTVDAATDDLATISDVTGISLTSGEINAPTNIPITVGASTITATKNAMTVGISDGKTFVGELNTGDKFEVDGTKYEKTTAGLLDTTNQKLRPTVTDTYYIGDEFDRIIAPENKVLDLTSETESALVYDSVSNPTTQLGTLTITDGKLKLSYTSETTGELTTLKIAEGADLTVDFETQVSANNSATVNGVSYSGSGTLIIDTTADTSTLYSGTITLAENESAQATNDTTALKSESGTINATASEGKFETISDLDVGESFTFNDKTYTQSEAGIIRDSIISEELKGDTINVSDLDSADWIGFLAPINGILDVTDATAGTTLVYDSATSPTKKLAILTVSDDGLNLASESSDVATAVETVTVAADSTVTVDFVTQVNAPSGTLTVNGETYNGVSGLVVDSDGETSSLYDGTVALDTTKPTVKVTSDTSDFKVESGSMNVTVSEGKFLSLGDLNPAESFAFNDKTYTQTAIGLLSGDELNETLAGETVELSKLSDDDWSKMIAPTDGTLDLTETDYDAIVCDNLTLPSEKFANLSVEDGKLKLEGNDTYAANIENIDIADGGNLTVDFATKVNAPIGSVTVNDATYNGTTALVLDSDGETSTLTNGTVSLAKDDAVTTTIGKNTITATDGDGITVSADDTNVTVDGLTTEDIFTVGDTTYKITTIGLVNMSGKFWSGEDDYKDGLTLAELDDSANWTTALIAQDGILSVDDDTLEESDFSVIFDDLSNPTKIYGTLARDESGNYSLVKDEEDNTLESIAVKGVTIAVDNDLVAVPVTITNTDGTETVLTVTADTSKESFVVDATGTAPTVADVNAVELSKGNFEISDGQTVTVSDDFEDVKVIAGNGTYNIGDETFDVAKLGSGTTVEFAFDEYGNSNSINELPKDSEVTIDGVTYTAPADDLTLHYTDEDGWYFDGYIFKSYEVTVDTSGNVLVVPGVKFSEVISSGRTVSDGTVQLAADINETPVMIINERSAKLEIDDKDGNTLVENLGMTSGVTFQEDGVEALTLEDVAGAAFMLNTGKTFTANGTAVTADVDDTQVGIGADGTSLSLDKSAQITAPANINLSLNAGDYEVNDVSFTATAAATATATSNGVELNLTSDALAYEKMTFSGDGTTSIDKTGGVTVEGSAAITNAVDEALTLDGTATIDNRIITTDKATEFTATENGVTVGKTALTVSGDTDGYTVHVTKGTISGLENIGSSNGVTIGGLDDATVKTDTAGTFASGDKSFNSNNAEVTYTFKDGELVAIDDADSVTGDFSGGLKVNGDPLTVTGGGAATISADDSGVKKIEPGAATNYSINGKSYEIIDDDSIAFNMNKGAVSGIESLENGQLIVAQDEKDFTVNDNETITLSKNRSPVTLDIADSKITSVGGVNGAISGLVDAAVYSLTSATINNKFIDIDGSTVNAIVQDGVLSSIGGFMGGSTVNSAPNVTITTASNGKFTFVDEEYDINDTLDASVDFLTNSQSRVAGIENFAGSISGSFDNITLNGKEVSISGADATISSDGDAITSIDGIENGTEINGDVADLNFVLPEGTITVNGVEYKLEGDENGALFVSNDGKALAGLDKDATLSVGQAGNYTINGKSFMVEAGDAFTVNRDSVYVIDPNNPPISEKTESEDILARGDSPVYIDSVQSGAKEIDMTGDNDLALIDSPNVNASIKTGGGNDSVVVRHDAKVTVDLGDDGETLIVPTAGRVTLENYNGDNAAIQSYDYSNLINAIKTNDIKFGDGIMTLGDALITFDDQAPGVGSTSAKLINAHGDEQAVAFTHTSGGEIDKSNSTVPYLMKGNYAESSNDAQKSGGSTLKAGSANDTILAGAGDYVDAGAGNNQIYLTDENLRNSLPEGATVVLGDRGKTTVHSFATGYDDGDDEIFIKDLSDLVFDYDASDLVMNLGKGQLTFENLSDNGSAYELKLTDGTTDYNAAVAMEGKTLEVGDGSEANVFYGNENGISFSEYTGAVEVNLNDGTGSLNGTAAMFYGMDKATAGAGDSSLIGAEGSRNTLTAGTGNSSIWSNKGRDLMVGSTSDEKTGSTTFFYMPEDGNDTITNFDFMDNSYDTTADKISLDDYTEVTDVRLDGNNVIIGINSSASDYLTVVDAKGKSFKLNDDLIAKVDDNVSFDGFTNCYVGYGSNATMSVGQDMGDVAIWLSDDSLDYHGIWYEGNFGVLDASQANGNNTLAGNELNNLILGGSGNNSMWGGYATSNDTLIGGAGQNTFFFALENGNDVIQGAHDGDLVSLEDIYLDNITRADVSANGVVIELQDGSKLDIQSNANIDYRLQDGSTYTADHATGQWVQK